MTTNLFDALAETTQDKLNHIQQTIAISIGRDLNMAGAKFPADYSTPKGKQRGATHEFENQLALTALRSIIMCGYKLTPITDPTEYAGLMANGYQQIKAKDHADQPDVFYWLTDPYAQVQAYSVAMAPHSKEWHQAKEEAHYDAMETLQLLIKKEAQK